MNINFIKSTSDPKNATFVLNNWISIFQQKSRFKDCKNIKAAQSIANQSIECLKQKHGHVWVAKRNEKICAILIADDGQEEYIIRFLVANVSDPETRGSGTFLVEKMLELAKKTHKVVRTTPENCVKYWRDKMGFQSDTNNPVEYIYKSKTEESNTTIVKKKKHSKKN